MKEDKRTHIISIKGNRDRWIDFVGQVKRNRERVWDVLERYIDDYMKPGAKKNGKSK